MQRTILITGCSSGMGLAAALGLKERGYRVFASARKPEDVASLTQQGFTALLLDVTREESIDQALDQLLNETGGRLDAVFNNAGFVQAGAIADLTTELITAQFATNVFGPLAIIRKVLPIMREQGWGRIIQNSSILGVAPLAYYGAYNASKFALEGFTQTLRLELKGLPIHAVLLNPGPIKTHIRTNAATIYEKTLQPHSKDSFYANIYQRLENDYFKRGNTARFSLPASAILKPLLHALESKQPKRHYYIGAPAQWLARLQRLLPESVFEQLLYKINS